MDTSHPTAYPDRGEPAMKRQLCCQCRKTTDNYSTTRTTDKYGGEHVWHVCSTCQPERTPAIYPDDRMLQIRTMHYVCEFYVDREIRAETMRRAADQLEASARRAA